MASRFQAASLVASPSYPNAIAWSDENLVAVASGHVVTILNPSMPFGPRGLITISPSEPFRIGCIDRKDLLTGCMLPICFHRDTRPCVRSISWSPIGLAPDSGCLLAVCTTDGRVKLFRFPFCEFSAEWVEVLDISEMLYKYLLDVNFWEPDVYPEFSNEQANQRRKENHDVDTSISLVRRNPKRRRHNDRALILNANPSSVSNGDESANVFTEVASFSYSLLQEGSSVEVYLVDGDRYIWVPGVLNQLNGKKAHVTLPASDGKVTQHIWVEMDPQYSSNGSHTTNMVIGQTDHFPFIRPSMKVDNLPENIFLGNYGVENILKVGQSMETWLHDRWFQCSFMGFSESGITVELSGDAKMVTLDVASVRFAPIWIDELRVWQLTVVKLGIKGQEILPKASEAPVDKPKNSSLQIVSMPKPKAKNRKKVPETSSLALISADKYASRNSMLASVVLAWSPLLETSEHGLASTDDSCDCCSILAIGGKSGMVSFWKVNKPQHYSIMSSMYPTDVLLVGILHAHMCWVTAMSWSVSVTDACNHQLLLATGGSDGSVKIWHCHSAELLKSSKTSSASFTLFHELISGDCSPVSVLSLTVPICSANKILLAVGKGSGALEVWTCDISTRKFCKIGLDDVHGHIVTGIAWAYEGNCLYSCNQDDSVHCWALHGASLCKISLPSNTPGVGSSTDVPNAFDACFGLALSPGNLVVAVVRRFDESLLNPMYQLRSQKAAVEFFWIGGQQQDKLLNQCPDFDVEAFSGFSNRELVNWDYNILWFLDQHEHLKKAVVIWDVVAALLAFKQFAPKYVDHILAKWLRSYLGTNLGQSLFELVSAVSKCVSNITTRRLHLLNIIIRCVVLADLKADKVNEEYQSSVDGPAKGQIALWMKLLKSSEFELRKRIVYCSFSITITLMSQSRKNLHKLKYWQPVGLAQMENWVDSNDARVRNSLKVLKSRVCKIEKSKLCSVGEYVAQEECRYCSAPVPFESAEVSFCQGLECDNGVIQRHKLTRCAVSMLVNDITPTWFCVCCHRRSSKLAPRALFQMQQYPDDNSDEPNITTLQESLNPLCVFCGILLQRSQPEFLLAASPV